MFVGGLAIDLSGLDILLGVDAEDEEGGDEQGVVCNVVGASESAPVELEGTGKALKRRRRNIPPIPPPLLVVLDEPTLDEEDTT